MKKNIFTFIYDAFTRQYHKYIEVNKSIESLNKDINDANEHISPYNTDESDKEHAKEKIIKCSKNKEILNKEFDTICNNSNMNLLSVVSLIISFIAVIVSIIIKSK